MKKRSQVGPTDNYLLSNSKLDNELKSAFIVQISSEHSELERGEKPGEGIGEELLVFILFFKLIISQLHERGVSVQISVHHLTVPPSQKRRSLCTIRQIPIKYQAATSVAGSSLAPHHRPRRLGKAYPHVHSSSNHQVTNQSSPQLEPPHLVPNCLLLGSVQWYD